MSDFNDQLGWLIRDTSNVIRGPFPRNEILQLIKKGQLKAKTEISRANSYWFSMEEKVEISRFFPELGGPRPPDDEQSTRMTATLTQADVQQQVEVTQFVAAPARRDLPQTAKAAEEQPKVEWLDSDAAAEFASDLESFTISMQTDVSSMNEAPPAPAAPYTPPSPLEMEGSEPAAPATPSPLDEATKKIPAEDIERMRAREDAIRHAAEEKRAQEEANRKAREDMLNRAQVKADTLPSERRDYQGERPKPINNVLKNVTPTPAPEPTPAPAIVSVPVDQHEAQATIIRPEDDAVVKQRRKKYLVIAVAGLLVAGLGAALVLTPPSDSRDTGAPVKSLSSIEPTLKKALLLFDLDSAKEALADYEMQAESKAKPILPLAQAILRKEFLYDTEGALGALQMAKALAKDPKLQYEVENLIAIYRFERDPVSSTEELRRITEANPNEPVFRYNWALALQRQDKPQEAIAALAPVFQLIQKGNPLLEDAAVLLGWARDAASKGNDLGAEGAFQKALELNPDSAKGRIGIAIYRLRKGGLKESESDFRAFVDSLPELDPPARVPNYRKMSDFDFYRYARTQIADLNMPGSAVGNKPSATIMAADAIISAIQSQNGDANKIVTDAVKAAPGDTYALKAMGYLFWKDGKFAEINDLFKDASRDRSSFAVNLLLAKADLKLGRKPQAEVHIGNLTAANPLRSDGWALKGEFHLQNGRASEARKSFQQALSRDPYDLLALRGLDQLKDHGVISADVAKNLPF